MDSTHYSPPRTNEGLDANLKKNMGDSLNSPSLSSYEQSQRKFEKSGSTTAGISAGSSKNGVEPRPATSSGVIGDRVLTESANKPDIPMPASMPLQSSGKMNAPKVDTTLERVARPQGSRLQSRATADIIAAENNPRKPGIFPLLTSSESSRNPSYEPSRGDVKDSSFQTAKVSGELSKKGGVSRLAPTANSQSCEDIRQPSVSWPVSTSPESTGKMNATDVEVALAPDIKVLKSYLLLFASVASAKLDSSNSTYASLLDSSVTSIYSAFPVAHDIGVDEHTGGPPTQMHSQSKGKTLAMETDISLLTQRLVMRPNFNDVQYIRYLPRNQLTDQIWRKPRENKELSRIIGGPADVTVDLAFNLEKLHRAYPPRWSDRGGVGASTLMRAFAQVSADVPLGQVIRAVRLVPTDIPEFLCKRNLPGAATPCRVDIQGGVMVHENRIVRDPSVSTSLLVEYYVAFTEKELFQLDERKSVTPGDVMVMKHPSLFSLRDCLKFVAKHGADEKPAELLSGNRTERLDCLLTDDALYYVDEIKRNTEVYPSVTDPLDRSTPWIISGVPLLFDVGDRFAPQTYAGGSNKSALDLLQTIRPATDSSNGPPGTCSNFLAITVPPLPADTARPNYTRELEEALRTNYGAFYTAFRGAWIAARRAVVFNHALTQVRSSAPDATVTGFEVVVHTADVAVSSSETARVAVAFLQIAAARAAGVQKLVFHLPEQPPTHGGRAETSGRHFKRAQELLDECCTEHGVSTDTLLQYLMEELQMLK
ncbi:hypothetical protein HK405_013801 [Cladochytrium tenue]|nr:hypothetical protein HK405_013801 [Cladochytrium tenue]